MNTKLLTLSFSLTCLFLLCNLSVSFAEERKDDVWVAEEIEGVGVIASVNGRITHGDRFRIRIEKNKCEQGELFFSFYTVEGNKDVMGLKGKVVEIKYNNEIINAQILSSAKFIAGHSMTFQLGFKPTEFIVNFHKDLKNISIELIDTENFKASDYFDMLKNEWSLNNLESSLKEAQELCRSLKGDDEPSEITTEYNKLLQLAEQGGSDAEAQLSLGAMYSGGKGVPQDYKEAVKWFRLSADQGYSSAQSHLGVMYANGQGVLQDYVLAHMWWNLSGSNGYEDAVINRNIVEKKMSPSQIEKAQEMARNWKPKTK